MLNRFLTVLMCALALAFASPAAAQYMYLDVNGDGLNTTADVLTSSSTGVDVWLRTNVNADGSTAVCNSSASVLNLGSYEYFVHATGTVVYGTWTDNLGFTSNFGDLQNAVDAYHGRGSGTFLPAGKYKLGRLALSGVADGATLSFLIRNGLHSGSQISNRGLSDSY